MTEFRVPITESEFQSRVTAVAEEFGWEWMHVGRVGRNVPNGAKGTLGRGWPDLYLVRGSRSMFAELKLDGKPLKPEQQKVRDVLSQASEFYVWHPGQWNLILDLLT